VKSNSAPRSKGRYSYGISLWIPYTFIAPSVLIFALFIIWPAFNGFYQSFFTRGIIVTPDVPELSSTFVGLGNYLKLLSDSRFLEALGNTLIFAFTTVPLIMVLSLLLGILLSKTFRGVGIVRSIVYWPAMISFIIVGIVWKWILGYESGILNYLLQTLGFDKVPWLTDPTVAMISVILVSVWASVGFYMVIYIAGLKSIPESYYEAAMVDGATAWQRFRYITLPQLRPIILLVMVLASINMFKVYQQAKVLTAGGPGRSTVFIVQNIYEEAFKLPNSVGYAAAESVIFFLIMLILTLVQFWISRDGKE
jgi:alpha-1,4-digalacturonate transport system permease protein